jgi:riboflavin kinase/FMN adenylyltransferase
MKVILKTGQFVNFPPGGVAAIGVFDGVHRGHQQVIGRAVSEARRLGVKSVVVTFDPHPHQVLAPQRFSAYVLTLPQRLDRFRALGVDICVVLNFTRRLAAVPPESFFRAYLHKRMQLRKLVVGADFHFGTGACAGVALLNALGSRYGMDVESVPILKINNIKIKTTKLKNFISDGDFGSVKAFLGRNYCLRGRVIHGDGRGRQLGFPTANLGRENVIIPPGGIYLIYAKTGRRKFKGLFYIGHRPSFCNRQAAVNLEAHLLDFKGSLYGREIEIEFLEKKRDDMKFPDEKSLADRIARDVSEARSYFLSSAL